jgi:tetratricopeptide (TPR) repeat protein
LKQLFSDTIFSGASGTRNTILAGSCLFLVVTLLFWPAAGFDLISLDDALYTVDNPMVTDGLTVDGIKRAFGVSSEAYWIPLLWISYMLDVELYGPTLKGFHITNILLHALNAALLFILLALATKRPWSSMIVSALFAVHPMRIESVAWISERKDVLSALFFLLSTGAYGLWARTRLKRCYLAVVALFTMGLMVKPILVTLPLLLLLLDMWPLERTAQYAASEKTYSAATTWRRLVIEKIPLFLLSIVFGMLTIITQKQAIHGLGNPEFTRWYPGRSVLSYFVYLKNTLLPTDLYVSFYDTAQTPALWLTGVLLLVIAGITAFTFRNRAEQPALLTGWAWFIIALLPVCGIIPVGKQWVADRFTYIPHMGLMVAAVWAGSRVLQRHKKLHKPAYVAVITIILVSAALSWHQLRYWQDGIKLFSRSVRYAPESSEALVNLGIAYARADDRDMVIDTFQKSLQIDSTNAIAHYNLGTALLLKNDLKGAERHFKATISIDPAPSQAHLYLALAMIEQQNTEEAAKLLESLPMARFAPNQQAYALYLMGMVEMDRADYQRAAEFLRRSQAMETGLVDAPYKLALVLTSMGRHDEAVMQLIEAVRLWPGNLKARLNLAENLYIMGRTTEAIVHFREVVNLVPDSSEAHFAAGRIFEINGDGQSAVKEYNRGLRSTPVHPEIMDALEGSIFDMPD